MTVSMNIWHDLHVNRRRGDCRGLAKGAFGRLFICSETQRPDATLRLSVRPRPGDGRGTDEPGGIAQGRDP